MYDQAIFENYEMFLNEHSDEFSTPSGALKLITDNGMFRGYMEGLTNGLDSNQRAVAMAVANRQREYLLTESANVPGSTLAFGWTVLSFPILVDIYAEPVISELCNVYPVSSPVASIPRIKIMAYIRGYDGNVTQVRMPTLNQAVRPGALNLTVTPAVSNSIFTIASAAVAPATVTSDMYRINRRYTLLTAVQVAETTALGPVVNHNVVVTIKPDNRNQFVGTFTFNDNTPAPVGPVAIVGTLNGHINYDSGIFQYQVIYAVGATTSTFATTSATMTIRFMSLTTQNGRIKVKIQTEMTDVSIDQNEDFLIELPPEDIQDFRAIFKIDILRTLSEAIKRQIMLNKDQDLAFFLAASEGDMASNGAAEALNLDSYDVTGGRFEPNKVIDVFKAVIPKISILTGIIRKNFNMYPSYLVAGLKTAALLRSVQTFALQMPGIGNGDGAMGWAGDVAQMLKMKVLESNAIAEGKIYLSTKAPNNALEKSTIVDLIYQPLYIVTEVTDGQTRNYVRSRTLIEIPRTDGLGVINITGLGTYFT